MVTTDVGHCASIREARMLEQALFWLGERVAKSSGPIDDVDLDAWRCSLRVLHLFLPDEGWLAIQTRFSGTERPWEEEVNVPAGLDRKLGLQQPPLIVARALELRGERSGGLGPAGPAEQESSAQGGDGICPKAALRSLYRSMLPYCSNAPRMIAVAVAARLIDDIDTWREVVDELDANWHIDGIAFARPSRQPRTSRSLSYTPLILAYWGLRLAELELRDTVRETWSGSTEDTELHWGPPTREMHDATSRTISRSLLENWCLIHRAELPTGHQIKLEPTAYDVAVVALEQRWVAALRAMASGVGEPLLRLRPWPGDAKAALSIRYDVDRDIDDERIDSLVDMQLRQAGRPFGSWYYHPGDPARATQTPRLRELGQEVGLHLECAASAEPNLGVTHHSAPTSEYWRGDVTNRELSQHDASYGEFLAAQLHTPRPDLGALEQSVSTDFQACLWVTPLHFPLEGSTTDSTLEFFDLLAEQFESQIMFGGHVIIGAHPDVNPELLQRALSERIPEGLWCATVEEAVKRCQDVQTPGHVSLVAGNGDGLWLCSTVDLPELSVEVFPPMSTTSLRVVLNLKQGCPQRLGRLSPADSGFGESRPRLVDEKNTMSSSGGV